MLLLKTKPCKETKYNRNMKDRPCGEDTNLYLIILSLLLKKERNCTLQIQNILTAPLKHEIE